MRDRRLSTRRLTRPARRIHDRRRAGRATLLTAGLLYAIAALGLRPPYIFANLATNAPYIWQIQFVVAGIACCTLAVWPRSRAIYGTSLIMVNIAAGSRAMAFVFFAREPTAAAVWLMIVTFQTFSWKHLAPRPAHTKGGGT